MNEEILKMEIKNAVKKAFAVKNGRYSPEFEKAMKASEKNGNRDNQINAALTFGNKFAVNPETIWKWALNHNYDLTFNGHKIMKNGVGFVRAVLAGKSFDA
jgi:hypothetical protein